MNNLDLSVNEYEVAMEIDQITKEKFWSRVLKKSDNECWEWTATKNNKGYGQIWHPKTKRLIYAHRLSYLLHHGSIPENYVICHTCDNPSCVNPNHLFAGTIKDNAMDAASKGRLPKGEQKANHKLYTSDIIEIRRKHQELGLSSGDLAREYGVHRCHITSILSYRFWKHV